MAPAGLPGSRYSASRRADTGAVLRSFRVSYSHSATTPATDAPATTAAPACRAERPWRRVIRMASWAGSMPPGRLTVCRRSVMTRISSNWAAENNNHQVRPWHGPLRDGSGPASEFGGRLVSQHWCDVDEFPCAPRGLLDPTIRWMGIAGLGAYWTFNAY